jgi:outer membrane lipoprotein SlyB
VARLQDAQDSTGTKLKDDNEGTVEGPGKSAKNTAKEAGIGAAGGAAVGTLVHPGTGTLYGMAIGAMAGVIHSMAKKHQGPLLPPGTELTFILDRTFLSKHVALPRPNSSAD